MLSGMLWQLLLQEHIRAIGYFCPKYEGGRGKRGIIGEVQSVRTPTELKVKLMPAESSSMAKT